MRRLPTSDPRLFEPDAGARAAFVLDKSFEATEGRWHAHRRAQLVHASEGVLTITTEVGGWVAPPERAVWVPSGMKHAVASRRPFQLLTLYVEPGAAPLPGECRVVAVDRLVAELAAAAAAFGADYPPDGPEERLVRVILDRLPELAVAPILHLPEPRSPELARITRALAEDPTDDRPLEAWAASVGMTGGTLAGPGALGARWRSDGIPPAPRLWHRGGGRGGGAHRGLRLGELRGADRVLRERAAVLRADDEHGQVVRSDTDARHDRSGGARCGARASHCVRVARSHPGV